MRIRGGRGGGRGGRWCGACKGPAEIGASVRKRRGEGTRSGGEKGQGAAQESSDCGQGGGGAGRRCMWCGAARRWLLSGLEAAAQSGERPASSDAVAVGAVMRAHLRRRTARRQPSCGTSRWQPSARHQHTHLYEQGLNSRQEGMAAAAGDAGVQAEVVKTYIVAARGRRKQLTATEQAVEEVVDKKRRRAGAKPFSAAAAGLLGPGGRGGPGGSPETPVATGGGRRRRRASSHGGGRQRIRHAHRGGVHARVGRPACGRLAKGPGREGGRSI